MALETINFHQDRDTAPDEGRDAPLPGKSEFVPHQEEQKRKNAPNMVTIDRSAAERFMLAIEECVGDIQEQRELVDRLIESKSTELEHFQSDTIKKFNALIEATTGLKEKISATESYENYLEEQVKNANLTKEIAMLEQQLQKEKAEISLLIQRITATMSQALSDMGVKVSELKSADNIIEEKLTQFKEELSAETERYARSAEEKLDEAGSGIQAVATSQIAALKSDCDSMLRSYTEKCQQHLDIIKKQSIDFLKQCEAENKKLIEKVPAVADAKFSKKDVIIYMLAGVSIASLLVQMFV